MDKKSIAVIGNGALSAVSKSAGGVVQHISSIADFMKEHNRSKEEIERIRAQLEVIKTEIEYRYEFYNNSLDRVFEDRRKTFDKVFDVIKVAMEKGESDAVVAALRIVGDMAADSPLKDIESLGSIIGNGKRLEL